MIRIDHDGPVRRITLDRPEKRNALTPSMLAELADAAESLAHEDAGAVLLSGEGRAFCSGFDLEACRGDAGQEILRGFLRELSRAVMGLRTAPQPVVLCAHGAAVAGGAALLGGADVVVADRGAVFGYPVVRLGISPAVSAPFVRRGVGDGVCRARLLDPGLIDGARAARVGLVHELTDDAGSAHALAGDIAARLAAKPRGAMRRTRAWLNDIESLGDEPAAGLDASVRLTEGEEAHRLLERFWASR